MQSKHTAFYGPSPASVSKLARQTRTVPFSSQRPRLMLRIPQPRLWPHCWLLVLSRGTEMQRAACCRLVKRREAFSRCHPPKKKAGKRIFFFLSPPTLSPYLIFPFHCSRQMDIHTNSLGAWGSSKRRSLGEEVHRAGR